jgi:hypothetical protein
MATRGRPRIFVTLAEKQKAYRDRKREDLALRNSPAPIRADRLTILYREVVRLHNETQNHNYAHNALCFPLCSDEELEARSANWIKIRMRIQEEWETAHKIWYDEWKASGFPDGEWN